MHLLRQFDTTKPPFDDILVRQAFAHTVDLERYHQAIADIEDPIARGLLPPGMPGSSPIDLPDYNPEKARALLAQSRYANKHARTGVDYRQQR
jgi:ABC-type transport system substrate-binding protein